MQRRTKTTPPPTTKGMAPDYSLAIAAFLLILCYLNEREMVKCDWYVPFVAMGTLGLTRHTCTKNADDGQTTLAPFKLVSNGCRLWRRLLAIQRANTHKSLSCFYGHMRESRVSAPVEGLVPLMSSRSQTNARVLMGSCASVKSAFSRD